MAPPLVLPAILIVAALAWVILVALVRLHRPARAIAGPALPGSPSDKDQQSSHPEQGESSDCHWPPSAEPAARDEKRRDDREDQWQVRHHSVPRTANAMPAGRGIPRWAPSISGSAESILNG